MALDRSRGPKLRHCHITTLDIDVGAESSEITRIAAAGSSLLLGFSDGHVALFEWSPSSSPAKTLVRRQAWQLQGPPSALAIQLSHGEFVAGYAGTQVGVLMVMECQKKESASVLSSAHEGSTVSALLCGCEPGNAPQAAGVASMLFSADANGRIFRCRLPEVGSNSETADFSAAKAELCADVRSPVLALQLCEHTGRLLISTTERIAIVDDVLTAGQMVNATDVGPKMRWVGSKPHKGQLSAIFSRNFGLDALVAARPGGRLWVAEGATGMVQTTLKFQSADGEDKASLGRLVALDSRTVASWTRSEGSAESAADGSSTNSTITLLDLEAIAVSHEWSLPPVVDLANCSAGCLLIAHRRTVTLLLMLDSPEAVLRSLLVGTESRLLRDLSFLVGCLKEAQSLRQTSALPTREILHCLRPLVEAVMALDESAIKENREHDSDITSKEVISSFKAFVTELEDKEEQEASGEDDQLKLSLVVSPLANFPVAEGSGVASSACSADARHRAKDALVAEVAEAGWSFGNWGSLTSRAAIAGNAFVTPQLLSRCQHAPPLGGEKLAVDGVPAAHTSAMLPPEPEAGGVVLSAVGVTPFRSSTATLQYFSAILQWLVGVFDLLVAQDSAGAASSIASSAASAFELLCLYSVFDDRSETSSAWPMFGLLSLEEVRQPSAAHQVCSRDEMMSHMRTLASVVATLHAEQGAQSQNEPWASCKATWTAPVAMTFCEVFLCSASLPQAVLDRCLLRANGLAATGQGWPSVVRWLREKSATCCPSFLIPRQDAWEAWEAAFSRAEDAAGGTNPGCGANELHACLEAALGAGGRPNAVGKHLGSDCAARARKTFGLALASFPKVLPWNVSHWIRCALEASSGNPGQSIPRALLMSEFVQYLLRLLPTCARCFDIRSMLHTTLLVTLHGDFDVLDESPQFHLMRGRNIVVDSLIDRHAEHLTPDLLSKLRYPLGALLLLNGKEATEVSDEAFEKSVAAVVGILKEAHEDDELRLTSTSGATDTTKPPQQCPLCAPEGRTCAEAALARRRGVSQVSEEDNSESCSFYAGSVQELAGNHRGKRWRAAQLQEYIKEQTHGCTPSSCSTSTTCITRGDIDLACELKRLCAKSEKRWRYLLEAVSSIFKMADGKGAEPELKGETPARVPEDTQRSLTPILQLLVAFANIEPGAELASMAYSAIVGHNFSARVAAAMALPLWRAATSDGALFGHGGLPMDRNGVERVKMEPDLAMFTLPPAKQPPPPPVPALPPRKPAIRKSAVSLDGPLASTGVDADPARCSGFYQSGDRYVEISSDGCCARHLDDTGEQMHGVVMSSEPLALSGKIGYYFEIELVEVRPEEMPDGLTVGVTTTEPSAIQENPDTAEHIPDTWAVGYDGQLWDAKTGGLSRVDWDPRCLSPGDLIGVLVTLAEGELLVFHNGVACCPGPRGIPVDPGCPLYAVVDLLGAARAVQWRPKAQPPIGS